MAKIPQGNKNVAVIANVWQICHYMSSTRFQNYLRFLTDHKDYSFTRMAEETGLDRADFSKYASGGRKVTTSVFGRMLKGIREEDQAEALALWLQDQTPEEYSNLVHIVKASGVRMMEETLSPHTLEGALEILKRGAEKSVPLRNVITSLAQAHSPPSSAS